MATFINNQTRKPEVFLRDWVRKLTDEEIYFFHNRLFNRTGSDVCEAAERLQNYEEVDRWLVSANSASHFYDMLDNIQQYISTEYRKRQN